MLILGRQMLCIRLSLPQSPPSIVDAASSNQPALTSLNDIVVEMLQVANDDASLPPKEDENQEGHRQELPKQKVALVQPMHEMQ
jgi:hypothetical protein